MADLDRYLPDIAAGAPDAFGHWVAGAEHRLRLSLASFATAVDTEAVVQETLLRVWQVAPRVEPDGRGDSLLRLAVRIARNKAIDELRRARVDPTQLEALGRAAEHPQPAPPDPMLRRLIRRCLSLLPDRPKRALRKRLQAAGGRHDADLAAELGMKLNTYLQNIRRARLSLAGCLERQGVQLGGPS